MAEKPLGRTGILELWACVQEALSAKLDSKDAVTENRVNELIELSIGEVISHGY